MCAEHICIAPCIHKPGIRVSGARQMSGHQSRWNTVEKRKENTLCTQLSGHLSPVAQSLYLMGYPSYNMTMNIMPKLTCRMLKSSKLMYFCSGFHFLSHDRICKRSQKHAQAMPLFPGFSEMVAANRAIIQNAVKGTSYTIVTSKRLTNCGQNSSSFDQTSKICISEGNGTHPLFKWTDAARANQAVSTAVK